MTAEPTLQPPSAPTAGEVVLHIGTMKSGTSYLQDILEHHRARLAASGTLVHDRAGRAAHDLLERPGAKHLGDVTRAWDEFADRALGWSGPTVVLSMEFLCLANDDQIERIVQSLAPRRVRVVLTARDLGRTIPSAWQQGAKTRQVITYPDFLRAVIDAPTAQRSQQFWQHHDLVAIASRWVRAVGSSRMVIVTVPHHGSDEVLWTRFATAIGIDARRFEPARPGRRNRSLGAAEAEVLRRVNVRLGAQIDQPTYRRIVNAFVARRLARDQAGVELTVPPGRRPAVERMSVAVCQYLSDLSVRVVGDLDDLQPIWPPATTQGLTLDPEVRPLMIDTEDIINAAVRIASWLAVASETTGDRPAEPPTGA